MNFIDWKFWVTFPAMLCMILLFRLIVHATRRTLPEYLDSYLLLFLNLSLLFQVNLTTFVIFLSLTVTTYIFWYISSILRQGESRIYFLIIKIVIITLPLIFYKYSAFISTIIFGEDIYGFGNLIIPAGISFYTFQVLGLVLDSKKLSPPRFIDYMNFVSFFPQIVAGPIERMNTLMPQLRKFRFSFKWESVWDGIRWVVLGFFLKSVLSDNLDFYIDRDQVNSALLVCFCNFLFGLKIYFDFAGYSFIALGLGRIFGVQLTLNFSSPYTSINLREFWRNWHITLSYWFRDYIYIPLGGSRTRFWIFTLILVFILSGIWHGAGWNFIIWGAIHGMACVLDHVCDSRLKLPKFVRWFLTLTIVIFAWLPFYENRFDVLILKLKVLITPSGYHLLPVVAYFKNLGAGHCLTLLFAVLLGLASICLEWYGKKNSNNPYFYHLKFPATVAFTVLIILLGADLNNEFVYFSF